MTVVRLREKERIVQAITGRENLVVYGAAGMGKTYLITEILKELNNENVLYAPECTSLKRMLAGFLEAYHSHMLPRTQNTLGLKKMFLEMLMRERPYLVIDHIGNLTSRYCTFVQSVVQYTSLLISARSLHLRDMKELAIVTARFDTLRIPPLSRSESYRLIDHLIEFFRIGVSDKAGFKKKVYLFTEGNPMAMKEVCSYAENDKYLVKGKTNFKLLNLDRKIDEMIHNIRLL
ncbi:MAG: hypothetical protein GY941_13315 [Planctomycetes bacterium]|nr:hypothetical protein [Planctomycetota bacterium]